MIRMNFGSSTKLSLFHKIPGMSWGHAKTSQSGWRQDFGYKLVQHFPGYKIFLKSLMLFIRPRLDKLFRNGETFSQLWKIVKGASPCRCAYAPSGPGQLLIFNGKMTSRSRYFAKKLEAIWRWVLQQDNDPRRRRKSTTEWPLKKKICHLEQTNQSLDLNPVENVVAWWAIHTEHPRNLTEL